MVRDGGLGTIVQGDCIQRMADLSESSIELAFADPPFNIGYEYDVYHDRKEHLAYVEWSRVLDFRRSPRAHRLRLVLAGDRRRLRGGA